jgi:hypothetical protein
MSTPQPTTSNALSLFSSKDNAGEIDFLSLACHAPSVQLELIEQFFEDAQGKAEMLLIASDKLLNYVTKKRLFQSKGYKKASEWKKTVPMFHMLNSIKEVFYKGLEDAPRDNSITTIISQWVINPYSSDFLPDRIRPTWNAGTLKIMASIAKAGMSLEDFQSQIQEVAQARFNALPGHIQTDDSPAKVVMSDLKKVAKKVEKANKTLASSRIKDLGTATPAPEASRRHPFTGFVLPSIEDSVPANTEQPNTQTVAAAANPAPEPMNVTTPEAQSSQASSSIGNGKKQSIDKGKKRMADSGPSFQPVSKVIKPSTAPGLAALTPVIAMGYNRKTRKPAPAPLLFEENPEAFLLKHLNFDPDKLLEDLLKYTGSSWQVKDKRMEIIKQFNAAYGTLSHAVRAQNDMDDDDDEYHDEGVAPEVAFQNPLDFPELSQNMEVMALVAEDPSFAPAANENTELPDVGAGPAVHDDSGMEDS